MEVTVLSKCNLEGHIIICDPFYIVRDVIDESTSPKLEDFVPVDCTPEMLRNDEISLLYKYGMEDYFYELENWKKTAVSDWDKCEYGRKLDKLGFKNYCVAELGYGFGSYGVYEAATNLFIGQFCSDTGLVGAFSLEEILCYDESFDKFNTMPWAICFIPNYTGSIHIVNKNDKTGVEADINIVGNGNMKFYSKMVGF